MLARQFLWQDGVTYNHGTGHGVGAFLGVHEGPIGFSPRYPTPARSRQIISNEPGYYKAGAYGIRIENLVLVVESEVGDGKFLELETLTLCPIDLRLDRREAATAAREGLAQRLPQARLQEIGPSLKGEVKAWLKEATRVYLMANGSYCSSQLSSQFSPSPSEAMSSTFQPIGLPHQRQREQADLVEIAERDSDDGALRDCRPASPPHRSRSSACLAPMNGLKSSTGAAHRRPAAAAFAATSPLSRSE